MEKTLILLLLVLLNSCDVLFGLNEYDCRETRTDVYDLCGYVYTSIDLDCNGTVTHIREEIAKK